MGRLAADWQRPVGPHSVVFVEELTMQSFKQVEVAWEQMVPGAQAQLSPGAQAQLSPAS
jgi:hypothetical protein